MADKMFSDTFVPVGGKPAYSVLVSIGAHTLIIAAAIMVPVMASDVVMPQRYAMITFRAAPPLPPPMPPPGNAPRTVAPAGQPSIPVVAPDGITKEEPVQATPAIGDFADNAGIVDGGVTSGLIAAAPPASAVEQAPVRPGGDILPPTKIRDAAPTYPAIARAARVQGVVIIEATIGVNGKVQDARILRSIPLLDAAALDAVRQWEYTPTRLNGTPVAIVMTVTVNFRLQ
jgi:periplasmic protein TonB